MRSSNSSDDNVSKALGNVVSFSQNEPRNSDSDELREAQKLDTCLKKVRLAISQKQLPSSVNFDHPDLKLWKKEWGNLVVEKGVLYRVLPLSDNRVRRQLVLPTSFRNSVLTSLNDESGHLGFDKTYAFIRDRFFWPGMKAEVEKYCKTCERCTVRKTLLKRLLPSCICKALVLYTWYVSAS